MSSFAPRLREPLISEMDIHYASRVKRPRGRHYSQGAGPASDDGHSQRAPGVRGDGETRPLGSMDDVFTSADTKAQEVYIKSLRECFPDYAIVAEEGNLTSFLEGPVRPGAFFTVDPLD